MIGWKWISWWHGWNWEFLITELKLKIPDDRVKFKIPNDTVECGILDNRVKKNFPMIGWKRISWWHGWNCEFLIIELKLKIPDDREKFKILNDRVEVWNS
jgi:hypothetical protein